MAPVNEKIHYRIELAHEVINCSFIYPETADFFGNWISDPVQGPGDVYLSEWYRRKWIREIGSQGPNAEYSAFAAAASEAILDRNRCLFHAVAVRYKERAWLLTAPSGVGKSYQIQMLRELYPEGFSVICGDRPVLEMQTSDDEEIEFIVHPSPWNGKEGWQGAEAAPLAGIICLDRGSENGIEELETRDSVPLVFAAIIQTGEHEETIHRVAAFETQLLSCTPVWRVTSIEGPDSTRFLYEQLFSCY